MNNLKWYYPETIREATDLISKEKVIPHASGTNLLLRNLKKINGFVNLSNLPLHYTKKEDNEIEFGSMLTYNEIISELKKIDKENILVKSLINSADTPLRNRITIGGSIALAPPWSDIIGALLILDAKIILAGKNKGEFLIEEFLNTPKLKQKSLITGIKFKLSKWKTFSYRNIRTKKDMPAFHIVEMLKIDKHKIQDCKIIVTGTVNRYDQIIKVENYLKNKTINSIDFSKIEQLVNVKFSGKRFTDPEYSSKLAGIEVSRGIKKLVGI